MQNVLIYLAMIFIMLQAGCSFGSRIGEPSPGAPEFGSSVRMAVASQIVNPEAGSDAPVVGIDGKYAAAVAKKYQDGPKEPKERQARSIFGIVDGGK